MLTHYTDAEIKQKLKELVVIADSREQVNGHLIDWLDQHHIQHKSRALETGDYSVMLGDTVPTVPADQPRNRIDYLFGFPAGHWELESTRVIASDRSDHRPVVSVVRLIR